MRENKTKKLSSQHDAIKDLIDAVSRLHLDLSEEEFLRETTLIREVSSKLKNTCRHMRSLIECAIELVTSSLPIETMQLALIHAVNLVDASRGILYFWDNQYDKFDRMQSSISDSDFSETDLQIVDLITGAAHDANRVLLKSDIPEIPGLAATSGYAEFSKLRIIAVPISIQVEGIIDRIGVIYVDTQDSDRNFSEDDIWTLQLFASLTALSIRNIRVTGALRLAYRETVQALVKALEAKDPYTKGHSDRVAEYSERCAKRFHLPMDRMSVLYSAALLHDIGKIGIRENVLHKPTKLTSEEYDHIKKHPEISVNILRGLDFLHEENKILRQHHERHDGKGYPKGLKGDEISLEGAIIQVADAWDAMTSRRIYRKELDLESALSELNANSGTQFQPDVVGTFIEMVRDEGFVPVGDPDE